MSKFKLIPELFKSPDYPTLLLDGKYLAYRTQYSRTGGLSYSGIKTGLYYGFFNTIQQLMGKFYPIYIAIMWDTPSRNSIRKKSFPGYKNRDNWDKLTDEQKRDKKEFADAYENLMVICEDLGIASYILDGYEADDLFALWIDRFVSYAPVIIITRDEDMFQLISDTVSCYNPDDKVLKDKKWFKKTYGIDPFIWANIKAMAGCKSDTIPGLPGVGEETALKYYRNEPVKKVIDTEENWAIINKYYDLVVLPHPNLKGMHLPFKTSKVDKDKFFSFCQEMGFRSFIDDMDKFEPLFDL
jgi:5'-3' exonuclease